LCAYIKTLLDLKTDKRAVTALEYGLIAATIAAVVVGVFSTMGNSLNGTLTTIGNSL
jgi:pilus assembly protein Flp/PilA